MLSMKTLFIPIKSQNLAHYYRNGLILPANYYENRAEDMQSYFKDEIVLSEIKWTNETDCCLEIVLNKLSPINVSQNLKTINEPIPISRIKSIYFKNKEQKETTLWNINNSSAFIPDSIVKVEQNTTGKIIAKDELQNRYKKKNIVSDFRENIKKFDMILGGLAFMKLEGTSIMNYSKNYFVVLSDLNKIIEEELTNTNFSFNYKLKGILTGSASGWRILLQHLQKEITKDYVISLAKEKNVKLENGYILEFNKLDLTNSDAKIIYYLSIIATYGKGKQKKAEDLYFDLLQNKIKYNKEIVMLLFGMYEGYKALIHNIKNKSVKFKLNSKLDFYTIESVYQYVFNNIIENSKFEYLDNWCPVFENKINENDFVTYQILDKKIIIEKKTKPDTYEFLENFYQEYTPHFFAEINNMEISKIIDIPKLFDNINIKRLLSQFQKTIISNIETKIVERKIVIQKNIEKDESKQQSKHYTETELDKFTLKELQVILNTTKWKTKKPYITRILKQKNKSDLFL